MNIRPETTQLLEENIGSKLLGIGLGSVFSGLTQKAKATKAKINKCDYIKLKRFPERRQKESLSKYLGEIFAQLNGKKEELTISSI